MQFWPISIVIAGNNNEMTGNNNGIDIENYDVSDIMTRYRDEDENINTVYIGLSSTQDYITPSMISFSAELYKPNVCYDYVVRRDAYTISSDNRLIDAFMNVNDELSITVAVKSLESDFDLTGSKLAITMNDTNGSVSFERQNTHLPHPISYFLQSQQQHLLHIVLR